MEIPIKTIHLFEPIEHKLIDLLKSLSTEDWSRPTLAKLWSVKDVAAHLLDTQLRTLSFSQNYEGDRPGEINSYQDLVDYLNRLNADWVKAMKRVSPDMLIHILECTQKPFIDHLKSLDPFAPAKYSVAWAGENESHNWFDIAREYTERWHHQQQIREAVNKPGIMDRKFFYPLIQTFMMALPYAYQNVQAEEGSTVSIQVTGESGGTWQITRDDQTWKFSDNPVEIITRIELDPDTSWKLFTKALQKEEAVERVKISGDQRLGKPIFKMLSVMA